MRRSRNRGKFVLPAILYSSLITTVGFLLQTKDTPPAVCEGCLFCCFALLATIHLLVYWILLLVLQCAVNEAYIMKRNCDLKIYLIVDPKTGKVVISNCPSLGTTLAKIGCTADVTTRQIKLRWLIKCTCGVYYITCTMCQIIYIISCKYKSRCYHKANIT